MSSYAAGQGNVRHTQKNVTNPLQQSQDVWCVCFKINPEHNQHKRAAGAGRLLCGERTIPGRRGPAALFGALDSNASGAVRRRSTHSARVFTLKTERSIEQTLGLR